MGCNGASDGPKRPVKKVAKRKPPSHFTLFMNHTQPAALNLPLRDFLCTFSFSLHLFPSIDNETRSLHTPHWFRSRCLRNSSEFSPSHNTSPKAKLEIGAHLTT